MAPAKETIVRRKRAWLAARARPPAEEDAASGPPPSSRNNDRDVAITDLKATAVREPAGGRAYVIVTVATDAGVSGIGEAAAGVDPLATVRRFLALRPLLVGRSATAVEAARRSLEAVSSGEGDGLQGAVNMALLDILGKLAKAPVYEVLGGPTRAKARALAGLGGGSASISVAPSSGASTSGTNVESLLRAALAAGFRAFLVALSSLRAFSRRAAAGGHFRAGGRGFFREVREELESLRELAGGADFVLDCEGRLSPGEASRLSRELERFHLLWLEDPAGPVDRKKFAGLAAESVTPVGYGSEIASGRDVQELLRMDAVDVLRPDIRAQGITQIRKEAALAETYYIAMAPSHRGGPIATATALALAASLPNFFIQEVPFPGDARDALMRRELCGEELEVARDGFFALPRGPGLGVALNEDAVAKYEVKER